jgi:release factor glutamine methyltransferase
MRTLSAATMAPKPPNAASSPNGTVREALARGTRRLIAAALPSATLDAEFLLLCVLDRDRAWIYTHPEELIDRGKAEAFSKLIERRIAGEPTQYLTGRQEFWGLEFEVNAAVLIPRPETEHLIEVALERLGPERRKAALRIVDVGTGSGCIAVALAKELPAAQITATDISQAALQTAARNAARHRVSERIRFIEGDLLAPFLKETAEGAPLFDLVVSNPPYIGREEAGSLPLEVREHEPEAALYGGETGNELYASLLAQAAEILAPGGQVVVELGYRSLDLVRSLLEGCKEWRGFAVTLDLAGIARVASAERSA